MASNTVFVSNFPFSTTEEALRDVFAAYCEIRSVRIIVDRETGRSRGFAFVEVVEPASIDAAIESLDGSDFGGRRLSVSRARGRAGATETRSPSRGTSSRASDDSVLGAYRARRGEESHQPAASSAPFRHRIVVEWSDEEQAYSASVPSLGTAASGATIEDAIRAAVSRARVAAEHLSDEEDDDRDPPPAVRGGLA